MNSPRYRPAGLLVEHAGRRVMLDGGPGAEPPPGPLEAWLVTDLRSELVSELRRAARARGLELAVRSHRLGELSVAPKPVVHTNHPAYGYLLRSPFGSLAWAPEFLRFPRWAFGVTLLFAEAAAWDRPIWFAGKVGGHAPVLEVCEQARRRGVGRLVLCHVGRPTIRALDRGERLPFGELGVEGAEYALLPSGVVRRSLPRRLSPPRGSPD